MTNFRLFIRFMLGLSTEWLLSYYDYIPRMTIFPECLLTKFTKITTFPKMTAVPKWLLSHSNYIPRITIFPKLLLSYNYYIPRTTLLLYHNYYIPRMTTSQNSYFTIVTRYITIMTNFSIFLKDLFPRMASNYVTKITTFRNDYFPKMKIFPYLVHSQN